MADDAGDADEAAEDSAPLGDLAERVRTRRTAGDELAGEPATTDEAGFGLEQFFEEESFEALESDGLWESLDDEAPFAEEIEAGEASDEHIVPKRQYCEGCEHFSTPPEVHCTHPGTTIVEFEDIDHVRVRNCPIVAERQALGDTGEAPMTQMSFGNQESD